MRDALPFARRSLAGMMLACAAVGGAAAAGSAVAAAKGSAGMEPPKGERCSCGDAHEAEAPGPFKARCPLH